jgi:hypothetical protein
MIVIDQIAGMALLCWLKKDIRGFIIGSVVGFQRHGAASK